jgi:hypothetical protein
MVPMKVSIDRNIATCQNSGILQPHKHECVMHDTRNIVDPTIISNHGNHL